MQSSMQSGLKGVFLDRESVDNGDMDLSALHKVLPQCNYFASTNAEQLPGRLADVDIVISNKVAISGQDIIQNKKLKLICVAATGINNVDLAAAKVNNVTVCNVKNYATPSVVQHVFTLILALTMRLPEYQDAVKQGKWNISRHFSMLEFPVSELSGKIMGIVGYGTLGQAVAEVARAFGMTVLVAVRAGSDPHGSTHDRVSLQEILQKSDVLSLHCPLTDQTRGLIGKQELDAMKPGALLINTARGGIVDEEALATAVKNRSIAGAGVDVLTTEPPVAGNPLLDVDLPNLIVTPHIAWSSIESRQRLIDEVAENIRQYLNGSPQNVVV